MKKRKAEERKAGTAETVERERKSTCELIGSEWSATEARGAERSADGVLGRALGPRCVCSSGDERARRPSAACGMHPACGMLSSSRSPVSRCRARSLSALSRCENDVAELPGISERAGADHSSSSRESGSLGGAPARPPRSRCRRCRAVALTVSLIKPIKAARTTVRLREHAPRQWQSRGAPRERAPPLKRNGKRPTSAAGRAREDQLSSYPSTIFAFLSILGFFFFVLSSALLTYLFIHFFF